MAEGVEVAASGCMAEGAEVTSSREQEALCGSRMSEGEEVAVLGHMSEGVEVAESREQEASRGIELEAKIVEKSRRIHRF